jgi:hypothetical protein
MPHLSAKDRRLIEQLPDDLKSVGMAALIQRTPKYHASPIELRQQHLANGRDTRGCYKRHCLICRHVFYATRPTACYCGRRCTTAAHIAQRKKRNKDARRKVCGTCRRRFNATRRDARFCSDTCRQRHHRKAAFLEGKSDAFTAAPMIKSASGTECHSAEP